MKVVEAHFHEQSYQLSRERIDYCASVVTSLTSECSLDTHDSRKFNSKYLF
jgi:hypothetical protein